MLTVDIKKQMHSISSAPSQQEKHILAASGFRDLFQFSRIGLYFYSTFSKVGEGILRLDSDGVSLIPDWREDIRNMPPIYHAIQERKPYHITSQSIHELPLKYTQGTDAELLVVPFNYHSQVIGYACMGSTDQFIVKDGLLQSLEIYGNQLGQLLGKEDFIYPLKQLSRREIEVLQKMSWGESTKEMAVSLGISEFTIQDYVRSALRKLDVLNRVQAVAEALRRGIIE